MNEVPYPSVSFQKGEREGKERKEKKKSIILLEMNKKIFKKVQRVTTHPNKRNHTDKKRTIET